MKIRINCLTLLLFCGICQYINGQKCDISKKLKDKQFPDLFEEGKLSYVLSAEFTVPNLTQTNLYHEDYDILNKKGMIESFDAGKRTRYYYNFGTTEAHEVSGRNCTLKNVSAIPDFMDGAPEEWLYTDDTGPSIKGPSAMFRYALRAYKNNPSSMGYMGISKTLVRGLKTQYWRRCKSETLTFDYYFTIDDHEDAYGFPDLKRIPLRIVVSGKQFGIDAKMLPQIYDILFFEPFIPDATILELPQGYGCRRAESSDSPDLPSFDGKNLFFYGEAAYSNKIETDEVTSYYNTFMFALDIANNQMAHYFTPWGKMEDKKQTLGDTLYVIYGTKDKYLYSKNDDTGECTIARVEKYVPRYILPEDGGYIDITDPAVLFSNNEMHYLGDGTDRGLKVHIFEQIIKNLDLGTRTIPLAIVTHYYLKDNEILRTTGAVKNDLTRISMVFLDKSKKNPFLGRLTFNFFAFSTQVPHKNFVFNIIGCFKNNDDILWITVGFPSDKKVLDKIKSDVPSIEENIMGQLTQNTELSPIRVPIILVDFADLIYVTILVLDKPPVMLDYLEVEKGKTIIGTTEVEGIISLDGCAKECLEYEDQCWGFAFCGAKCLFGTGTGATVSDETGCDLYRRYNNDTFIPSKENMADKIKQMVDDHEFKLVVPTDSDAPIELEASYVEITSPGESDELFELMGKQLNPRLRVVTAGAKLTTGEKVKNLGRLRYDECQRVCLDYKSCETVSFCLTNSECILSTTYIEDIPKTQIKDDNFCNLLARKYTDEFDRSPGNVLSQTAKKSLNLPAVEDCAKACVRETDFKCLSFDHCPSSEKKDGCRLHAVHILDVNTKEQGVSNNTICGHYSRKFSYDFKKETDKKTVGSGFIASTNVTMEQCSRSCIEYGQGTCFGFDFCQDKTLLGSTCTLLNKHPATLKTAYSDICNHFTRDLGLAAPPTRSTGTAAGIGILCFAIGGVLGAAILFLVMYFRMNKSR